MVKENQEPISKDESNALFEKLAHVEELLEKQATPEVTKADFDKMSDAFAELKGQVDELAPTIQKMASAEKPDFVVKSTVDELSKKLDTIQKQVKTIETMPMMKGMQDVGGEPEKYDVLKGVFKTAFPEAGGK